MNHLLLENKQVQFEKVMGKKLIFHCQQILRPSFQTVAEWSERRFEDGARSETFTGRLTSLHLVLVAFALSRTLLPARQLKRINVFEAFKGANDTIVTDQTGRLRGMAQSALGAAALTMPEFSTLCDT